MEGGQVSLLPVWLHEIGLSDLVAMSWLVAVRLDDEKSVYEDRSPKSVVPRSMSALAFNRHVKTSVLIAWKPTWRY